MSYTVPRCQVIPQADHQVAFLIDGRERLRWHHGPSYPRPFFYPLLGPSGSSLTRMGHPGAPNHDHHRSVWFAHNKVLGIDFWSDSTEARIRQQHWLAYADGDEEAAMAVQLGWYDGHDPQPLVEQELIAAVRPGGEGETLLELQASFRPRAESLEFGCHGCSQYCPGIGREGVPDEWGGVILPEAVGRGAGGTENPFRSAHAAASAPPQLQTGPVVNLVFSRGAALAIGELIQTAFLAREGSEALWPAEGFRRRRPFSEVAPRVL
jgi:hypothetical protein